MNYPRYQKIVEKQLGKYGQSVTFQINAGESEYDPISGQFTQDILEVIVNAVLLRPESRAIKEGLAKAGDAMLLVGGGLEAIPDETSKVIVRGECWQVIKVITVAPAETALLYKVYIRRG